MRGRRIAFAAIVACAMAIVAHLPGLQRLDGLTIDLLHAAEGRLLGARPPTDVPVVVVAVDEATYRAEPFRDTPAALWTPQFARVVDALLAADAAVVGLDLVLPTSAERFLPGHDREFLVALRRGAREGRIVLAEVRHQEEPIRPFVGQRIAVGHDANIRVVNLPTDADDVVRRVPLAVERVDGAGNVRREPGFALELAVRGTGRPVALDADGATFDGRRIGAADGSLLLRFRPGTDEAPTLSMADVHACAEAGRIDRLREAVAGRIVLIGTVLDVEDRKLTSKRLATGPEGTVRSPSCAEPTGSRATPAVRETVSGVYVHAAAIANLVAGTAPRPASRSERAGLVAGLALAGAGIGVAAAPLAGALLLGGMLAAAAGIVMAGWAGGVVLPGLLAAGAGAAAWLVAAIWRFTVDDRDRRRVRRLFGLYVSGDLLDRMGAEGMPSLGGERRELTILFTDLEGFTTLSERTDPLVLAPLLNAYLDGVCAAVMANGGMVNEFVGDAVLAYFGAPTRMDDHAARAIAAARDIDAFAERFRTERAAADGIALGRTRVGVHTGWVVLGNFGSSRRFKYTAVGDTVNTASRIEGLNKHLGTRLCVSAATVAAAADPDVRPVADVVLKGRSEPMTVHEILPAGGSADPGIVRYRAVYARLAEGDPTAAAALDALAAEGAGAGDPLVALHRRRLAAGETGVRLDMVEK
jgi:adenylate cyclase